MKESIAFIIFILVVISLYYVYYFYKRMLEYKDNIIVLQKEAITSDEYNEYIEEIKECNNKNGILKLYIDRNARKPSPIQPEVMMKYTYTKAYCIPKEIYKKQRYLYNINKNEYRHKIKEILECNADNKIYKLTSGYGIRANFVCE
jgi:hypothetical protein